MIKISKHRFLLISILFFLGFYLTKNIDYSNQDKKSDFHSFSENLIEKEQILDKWMDSLDVKLAENHFSKFVNNNSHEIDWLFNEYGISFYIFTNNQYVYWTNNSIVLPTNPNKLQESFANLGSASVVLKKRQVHGFNIIGLILIKTNFPYENEFLKNEFHSSFSLSDDTQLINGDKNDVGAIFNKERNYLFTLKKETKRDFAAQNTLLLLLLILGVFSFLLYGRDLFHDRKFKIWHFLIFSTFLISIRFFIQYILKPDILLNLPLFNPRYFASSELFPSLGDLVITVGLISYLIFVFYSKVHLIPLTKKEKKFGFLLISIWLFIIHIYSIWALSIFRNLIVDSTFNFEAYNVLKLSIYSIWGYLVFILSFAGFILLVDKAGSYLKNVFSYKHLAAIIVSISILTLVLWQIFGNSFDTISYLAFLLITLFWLYIKYYRETRFVSIFILVALFSAYATNYIHRKSFEKRIEETKVTAVNLAREQDPVAEVVIEDAILQMKNDSTLKKLLLPNNFEYDNLFNHLKINYFEGYLRRYNMQVTICNPTDSLLVQQNENNWFQCYNFFNELATNDGIETNIKGLYYLQNSMGLVNYLFRVTLQLPLVNEEVSVFIELIDKPNQEVLGYPELLLEKTNTFRETSSLENYAKFTGNQLLSRVGEFPYAFDRSVYKNTDVEFAFFQSEDFDHLVYNYGNSSIIISQPTIQFYNILISFTYIFFFFLIMITILSIIGNRFTHIIDFQFSIRNKITYSMILILFISMIFVGGGTVLYTISQFENNQYKILSEKIQSVLVELEHKLSQVDDIDNISEDYLNSLLVKFSNVFYTDINLYDLQGNLLATSRREIFDRKLTSNKINAIAYRELVLNKKARIVHKENIGELSYYSAYVPFISSDNQLLAYLNLPYFSKEILLRQELLKVLVAVINIYAFLIILSIIMAIYMSNRLTEPLRLVQQRIKNIDLSKKNERINYTGKDEIGDLVGEYNKMLDELDQSTMLLAKSERESAWREMARQIAHEIKNPLTPMKLSVQLLEKSWQNKDNDFNKRFERVTQTLIEQIDSLSSIASSFSQFAQIPIAQFEKVNIVQRLQLSSELFDECSNVKILFDNPEITEVFVYADNERMLQVFNNLIKNAIQAVPPNRKGEVHLCISKSEVSVVIEIMDNGIGIPEQMENNLFQPNFTTKSSGTGLGLAIVKNIIEEFGGAIWFKSKVDKGSSFFISMPLYKPRHKTYK